MFQNWPSLQHTEIASWEGELSHVGGMSCGRSALCKKSCPYNIPKSYVGKVSCRKSAVHNSAVLLAPRLATTRLCAKKFPPRQPASHNSAFHDPASHNSALCKKKSRPGGRKPSSSQSTRGDGEYCKPFRALRARGWCIL